MLKKMKNRRNKANSSSSESKYLPPEIWTRILSSLPAKTLLKFRCVCKSWCSIIDNPYFIHMHFQFCKFNSWNNNTKLFVTLEGLRRNRHERCTGWFLTVREANTLQKTGHIFRVSNLYNYYHILGSCNGLLLMVLKDDKSCQPSQLRLWNPCIYKSLVLPPIPSLPYHFVQYLFGFALDNQDYKVVAFRFDKIWGIEPIKIYFAVYTLRDQQWTVRNDPLNVTNLNILNTAAAVQNLSTAIYFRGGAYWLGQNDIQSTEFLTHLGSFDFDKENITFLELPFSPYKTGTWKFLFLLKGSLAVFRISKATSNIWVLEQDNRKGPWTLWFSGKSSCNGYNMFRECVTKKIFYCERDGGYYLVCGKKTYNIVSCQVHELDKSMSSILILEKYSESLVLSKGYKSRDLRYLP